MRILDTLARRFPLRLEVTRHGQVPHSEALAMKRQAHVVIDECVTGSYHRNSLEGLAAGCVVFNGMHLRPAVMETFARCSGTSVSDSPFHYADLDSLQDRLVALIERPLAEVVAMGRRNREWMEAHWNFAQQWERCWLPAITAAREKRSKAPRHSVAPQPSRQRPIIRDFRSSLSVVIPHGGDERLPLLAHTLEHLRRQEEVGEIVVVEMGSHPSAAPLVRGNEKYQFIEDAGVFHKARVMNAGLALASRDLLFWLDNDLIVPAGFLNRAIDEKKRRNLHCLIAYANAHFLSETDSRAVIAGTLSPSHAVPISCNSTRKGCRGGAVLADREWVRSCGGMREEFRGWGGEDDAWHYFSSHFGKVAVTDQPDQNLFHLYHRRSGGYGSDEHFATNPYYAQNVALLRKLMRMRTRSEVLEQFPISLPREHPCPSVIET